MFHERAVPKSWCFLLVLLFLAIYLPNAWLTELNRAEAEIAVSAAAMKDSGSVFAVLPNAGSALMSPLSIWILAGLAHITTLSELVVRLPAILAFGLLAALCAYVAYRSAGLHAAGVTAVATMSCYLALWKGLRGTPDAVFALLLTSSWLVWYKLSRGHRRWLYAWFASLALVLLSVLCGGIKAVLLFYLPLFFLRRPLKIWRRLGHADHLLCLFVLLVSVGSWTVMSPYQVQAFVGYVRDMQPQSSAGGYITHLMLYPIKSILVFFPWIFVAWPAFCMAFRPLEKDAVFGQFLRTVVISIFIFFWLLPTGRAERLAILIGPMSILCGLNYDILVRRYGKQLLRLPRWLCRFAAWAVLGTAGVVAIYAPDLTTLDRQLLITSVAFLLAAGIVGFMLFRQRLAVPIWYQIGLAVMVVHLVWVSTYNVYAHERASTHRQLGRQLVASVPKNVAIYQLNTYVRTSPILHFYLGRKVTTVDNIADLPLTGDLIYAIGTERQPISRHRVWHREGARVVLNGTTLQLWRGEIDILELTPDVLVVRGNEAERREVTVTNRSRRDLRIEAITASAASIEVLSAAPLTLTPGDSLTMLVTVPPRDVLGNVTETVVVEITDQAQSVKRTVEVRAQAPAEP